MCAACGRGQFFKSNSKIWRGVKRRWTTWRENPSRLLHQSRRSRWVRSTQDKPQLQQPHVSSAVNGFRLFCTRVVVPPLKFESFKNKKKKSNYENDSNTQKIPTILFPSSGFLLLRERSVEVLLLRNRLSSGFQTFLTAAHSHQFFFFLINLLWKKKIRNSAALSLKTCTGLCSVLYTSLRTRSARWACNYLPSYVVIRDSPAHCFSADIIYNHSWYNT